MPSVWKQLLLRDIHKADEIVSLQTKGLQGDQSQAESLCAMLMMQKKKRKEKKLGRPAAAVLILRRINLSPFPATLFLENLGPISRHLPLLPHLGAVVGGQRGLMKLEIASPIQCFSNFSCLL